MLLQGSVVLLKGLLGIVRLAFLLISGIKQYYDSMKLKHKLFVVLSSVVLIGFGLCMAALQIALHIYEEQLYSDSAQILRVSLTNIEKELGNIEKLSFTIMSDNDIQKNLEQLDAYETKYDYRKVRDQLLNHLQSFSTMEKYIASVNFIDLNDRQDSVGIRTFSLPENRVQDILAASLQRKGGNVWIQPNEGDPILISSREIRKIPNLSLKTLGYLIIRVDLNRLVSSITDIASQDASLFIISDGAVIFQSNDRLNLEASDLSFRQSSGYAIQHINHKKYYMTNLSSNYTDWNYVYAIPYDPIFHKITVTRNAMLAAFLLIFIIIIFISAKFSNSISMPISNLILKMKRLEQSELNLDVISLRDRPRKDEIGQLYRDFEIMINKINALAKENYAKQLTIKDTEYRALQAQINPHFLYNTLDSIYWMTRDGNLEGIASMVDALGELLRNSISRKEQIITLEEELQILRYYVTIQKIRYEDRLDFQVEIAEELMHCIIPKLILQPIVENSIHYGLEKMVDVCRVTVKARGDEERLELIVEDNGPGMDPRLLDDIRSGRIRPKGSGIGLNNIRDRIRMVFGESGDIHVWSEPDKGTIVGIRIPYKFLET